MAKRKTKEPKFWGESLGCWTNILAILAGPALILLFLVVKRIFESDKQLIPYSIIPIILGIIFELKRLKSSWKEIGGKLLFTLAISPLIAFLPGKNERNYSFDGHIQFFPFVFILVFLVVSIVYFIGKNEKEKLVPVISEGIVLLQSISIIYLITSLQYFDDIGPFKTLVLIVGLLFVLVSLFYAFTDYPHNRFSSILLSIWSSVITLIFAVNFIIRAFENEISFDDTLDYNLITTLQYFLLGISSIYMLRNAYLIFGYLPSKGESSSDYKKRRKEISQIHFSRFSNYQVNVWSSVFCVVFIGSIFMANSYINIFSPYTLIWLVFTLFPYIMYYWEEYVIKPI